MPSLRRGDPLPGVCGVTMNREPYFTNNAPDWSKIEAEMNKAGIFRGQLWEDKRAQPRNIGPSFKRRLFVLGPGWSYSTDNPTVHCRVTNRTKYGYPEAHIKISNLKKVANLLSDPEPTPKDE